MDSSSLEEALADGSGLIGDVLAALAEPGALRDLLDTCAQAIVDRLDAALVRIWTLNAAARVLELQASAGLPVDRGEPYTVPVGTRMVSRVIQSRRPEVIDDIAAEPLFDAPDWAESERIVGFAAHPLISADRLIGVITLFARQPLPVDGLGHLEQVTGALATHIQRARHQQELHAEHGVLVRLHEATGALLRVQFDLEQIAQTVTNTATELSGAASGVLFYEVLDDQGETSTLYTVSGAVKEDVEDLGLPHTTPLFEPTYRGACTVRLDDVTTDPRYGQAPPHHGLPPGHPPVRSYLAVPVVGRSGKVLGSLFLGHPEPGRFDELAEMAVATIAGQAALAIENAYLYGLEHSAAATLQRSLLPRRLPTLGTARLAARYQPAAAGHDVGGDWYDAIALPDGRLALTIGDVCGHDIEAAAVMGQLRAAIRAYTLDDPDPAGVVARIDEFCTLSGVSAFTTLIQALYDPTEQALQLVRAGHPVPLLIEADGSCEPIDVPGVPPLGTRLIDPRRLPDAQATVALPAGSTVLLYTDGLIERRTWTLREGLAHLVTIARRAPRGDPDQLCEHVINQLVDGAHDDTAVLALTVVCASGCREGSP